MKLDLQEKVVLVTGAAGDIGSAIARAFATEGSHLALIDQNKDGLQLVAGELREQGATVSTAVLDIANPQAVFDGLHEALQLHRGRVDIVINNAGICPAFPLDYLLDGASLPDWRRVMDVNFYGHLHVVMALLPLLLEQRSGVILNIASDLARQPRPEMLHYSASKAAMIHVTQGLAAHLGSSNIRAVALCPGATKTAVWTKEGGLLDLYAKQYRCSRDKAIERELKNRGMAQPRLIPLEEVANLACYLASPLVSAMTRTIVHLDNGSQHGY